MMEASKRRAGPQPADDRGHGKRARFSDTRPEVRVFADDEERDDDDDDGDGEEPAFGDDEDYARNIRKGALRRIEDSDDDDDDDGDKRAKKAKKQRGDDYDDEGRDKEDRDASKKEDMRRYLPKEEREAEEETGAEEYTEDGTRITPFNMREEFEEGNYDTVSGTFVETKDKNKAKDKWLDGLTREDIEKARVAQEARVKKSQNDKEPLKSRSTLIKEVLQLLQPGETVFAALRRLGKSKKKPGKKNTTPAQDEQAAQDKKSIEAITEAADQLLAIDYADIYELNYDQLNLELRRFEREESGRKGSHPSQPPSSQKAAASIDDGVRWEYKWAHDGEVFGPFDTVSMKSWVQQGYFGESVLIRKLMPVSKSDVIDLFGDSTSSADTKDAESASYKKGAFVNVAQVNFE